MESLHLFLREATQELLYNIVYDECEVNNNNDGGIEFRELSEKFETRFGYRPMDFFNFGNESRKGWVSFLKSSPGLCFIKRKVFIFENEIGKCVAYKKFNETKIHFTHESLNITVAKYRQMLIQKACDLVSQQTDAVCTDVTDSHGNTPLYLIAALPCIDHKPTLVQYLLKAGFKPHYENNNGQTMLHIIAGRMQAEVCKNDDGSVRIDCESFGKRKFDPSRWPANDRTALLKLFSSELSHRELTVLANTPNRDGNTAMHEWVISLSTITSRGLQLGFDVAEKEIGLQLLSFGVNLRQQNDSGDIPLHFAYNSEIFQFLLEKSKQKSVVCCRARNEREETPLLCILNYATNLVSNSTKEEKKMTAVFLLQQLTELVTKNEHICKTAWMPDESGNSAVDIILSTLRKISHSHSSSEPGMFLTNFIAQHVFGSSSQEKKNGKCCEFRKHLISLLERSLCVANEYDLNRRSLLHELIDLGNMELLQSVEMLLKNNAKVNAIDSKGRTPLDVIKEYKSTMPSNSFFMECEKRLLQYGATCGPSLSSSVDDKTSVPNVDNKVRKILSCPKKHSHSAQRLIKNNDKVTVVDGKYRYSSQDPIGSGAFSSIFVAVKDENVHNKSGRIDCRVYALKRMEKAKRNPDEFKREINTLLFVSGKCENIIKYHESLDDNNFQYLCLDLMDGDLNEFVTNNIVNEVLTKDPVKRVQATKEIINGLEYLHGQMFIHRDLKPGNILYTTDPALHFKIADFGLTKNMSTSLSTMASTRRSGVAMAPGTRCWMAPELISMKSKEHTQRSDIFSLGLVFHYLLTLGKHPFATGSEEPAHVIERRIVDSQIRLNRDLDPEARSFLQQLLNQDPSKRPPAKYLKQHPFLWSERKKTEFLKAVGDQPEAASPTNYPNSPLEQSLQLTNIGQIVQRSRWGLVNRHMIALFAEITTARKQKKYRTDKVIDLLRFIRNAYVHKQERSLKLQDDLDRNIFLQLYPSLVLDVFDVVQKLGFLNDTNRTNIQQALMLI
ncbi:serine threonine- kinase endoribonuclease IRE1-like [Paramuricea clavata]|uniref:Serine threonine- kinase endoribonuclease IRE1-like n=1 Tax=Paramuricea clavata TaxID=317549 RepID=A0A6S7IWV8_PARCT|nr:serine threonine- kinase endoribonuclease IRE1-like [Paramuricea clavata]